MGIEIVVFKVAEFIFGLYFIPERIVFDLKEIYTFFNEYGKTVYQCRYPVLLLDYILHSTDNALYAYICSPFTAYNYRYLIQKIKMVDNNRIDAIFQITVDLSYSR